jgi:hypothetical protein
MQDLKNSESSCLRSSSQVLLKANKEELIKPMRNVSSTEMESRFVELLGGYHNGLSFLILQC